MKVTIDIPDRIGWALTDHAEARGENLPSMIAGIVLNAFSPTATGAAPTTSDRVLREWSKGAPDPVIAHRLRLSIGAVRLARTALHVKPHKFRREQWEHELTQSTIQPPALSGVSLSQEEKA